MIFVKPGLLSANYFSMILNRSTGSKFSNGFSFSRQKLFYYKILLMSLQLTITENCNIADFVFLPRSGLLEQGVI